MSRRPALRLCLIGSGAIAGRVAELLAARPEAGITLAAIVTRPGGQRRGWWPADCRQVSSPEELAAIAPDIIVEAAGADAVRDWAEVALRVAPLFVLVSASALTDDVLREKLIGVAAGAGSQLVVSHGALGGIAAISAGALRGLSSVTHVISKPPEAWRGTAAEELFDPAALTARHIFFRGSAREAARRWPANANSVVTTSLAGAGLDATRVELVADPESKNNIHELHAEGGFGRLSMTLINEPMPENPKTSDMTALSLTNLLLSMRKSLVI